MAPMSWTLLFLFFTFMLIMINIMNYYLFNQKINPQKSTNMKTINSKNWKW